MRVLFLVELCLMSLLHKFHVVGLALLLLLLENVSIIMFGRGRDLLILIGHLIDGLRPVNLTDLFG